MTLKTPLYDCHVALGAQMVDFAGWSMPVRYSGDKAEHMAVRTAAGLFDVSHMGEIVLRGKRAAQAADRLITNDVTNAKVGQALYAGLLNEQGGFVDDVVAYKFSNDHILVCVNASNREKDFLWMKKILAHEFSDVEVTNESNDWAQLAIQGPKAVDLVAKLIGEEVREIGRYCFKEIGEKLVARTGYTGEDGFELFVPPQTSAALFNQIIKAGNSFGLVPCGLGARDTLRLEAGMCLYGNDIDDHTTPLEAGLNFVVKFDKATPFVGEPALRKQKEAGVGKRLVGIEMVGKGIARHGYDVFTPDNKQIGQITSGSFAPFLNKAIAMAYVDRPYFEAGTEITVKIRDQFIPAKIVKLPFYKARK